MKRRTIILALGIVMILGACTSAEPAGTTAPPVDSDKGATATGVDRDATIRDRAARALPAALNVFDACEGLLDWIQVEAGDRVGPYGFDNGIFYASDFARSGEAFATEEAVGDFDVQSDSGDGAVAPSTVSGGDDSGSFTGTNNQEVGVDEADLVKTDGTYLYVLRNSRLTIVDTASGERVSSVEVGEYGAFDMLISGDRIYVFGNEWIQEGVAYDSAFRTSRVNQSLIVVTEYDVSEIANPQIVSELRLDGQYITSRLIDGEISVVVSARPTIPFLYPSSPAAEAQALAANKNIIEASVLEDWIAGFELTRNGDVVDTGLVSDCERVFVPSLFSGFTTTSVLTIATGDGVAAPDAATIFAETHEVYVSAGNLYASTSAYPEVFFLEDGDVQPEPPQNATTTVHMFDISDPAGAEYVASGEVEGRLLNQFSMGEWEGDLRIAVTTGDAWWGDNGEESESSVVVLRPEGNQLVEVGRVDGLGVTERIYSVRFLGDTAYVVTFRQVDPLYVVDLADPTDPRVEGELKIPGFSSYLHPIGDGLVIGVGSDATEEGQVNGAKVSLFDVSDPTEPQEIDTWIATNAESIVSWDHRAFLWWAEENLAALPIHSWGGGGTQGAVLLDVTADGIEEVGQIDHKDQGAAVDSGCEILSSDDLPQDTELWYIAQEGVVQVCGSDDPGGYSDGDCEVIPVEELQYWVEGTDAEVFSDLPDTSRVELCWTNDWAPQIERLLVIDGALWSISHNRIQSNDLRTLETLHTIGL